MIEISIKQIRKICFILTILSVLPIGKVLAFNGRGQGTPESPYLILTADQLKEIKDDMDAHYKLVNDIEITTQWSYIGNSLLAFTGTLDGNYNQITLNIQNNTSTNTALFYQIGEHGIVKNLGVKIDKNTTNIQGGIQGGTIALKNSGIIEKCFSEGAISQQIDHSSPLTSGLGGIVGYNAPTGTVNNCYSSVSLKNTAVNEAGIGGIVGLNEGTVDHCIALNPQIESSTSQYTKDPRGNRIIGVNKATDIANNSNYASPKIDCIPTSNPNGMEGAILPQSIDWKEWNSNEKTFGLKKTDSENFGTTFHYSDHTYLTGEGTKDSPYLISSISDFQTMAKYLNNNYLDKGVHYKLTEDIDMDNKTFNPIGGENSYFGAPFAGILDGNGKVISNLSITPVDNETTNWHCGLFAKIGFGAQIKNLGLQNCNIVANKSNENLSAGLIAGCTETPKTETSFPIIDNCFVTGSIQIQKDGNAGGLIGKSDANNTNTRCTISNCYTNVDITITGGNWKQCDAAGISCTQYTTIQNCYALGNIQLGSAQNNNQNKTSAYGINSQYNECQVSSCLALMEKISSYNDFNEYVIPHSIHNNEGTNNNNYMSSDMSLLFNGNPISPNFNDVSKKDGDPWKGEKPNEDAWEITDDGYLNLKSIANTFEQNQQIQLTKYVPFAITVLAENGTIETTPAKEAKAGEEVSLTIAPNPGYQIKESTLKVYKTGDETTVVSVTDNKFTMPKYPVTITAEFVILPLNLTNVSGDITVSYNESWFYQLAEGTPIPFNGTITGEGQHIVSFDASTTGKSLTLDNAKISQLNNSASIIFFDGTGTIDNITTNTGAIITKTGITGNAVKKINLTLNNNQGGTAFLQVGEYMLQPEDQVGTGSRITIITTPNSNYNYSLNIKGETTEQEITIAENSFIMPDENVNITITFSYNPPYVPSYYDLHFEANDSVILASSDMDVIEGGSFTFTAEAAEGYDPETLVVEYKRGSNGKWNTLEAESNGKFRIRTVWSNIYVRASVQPIEDPTSIDQVENETSSVRAIENRICITTAVPVEIRVVALGGHIVRTEKLPVGYNEISGLSPGMYIVILSDGTRCKAIVR